MRDFGNKKSRLATLEPGARIVYTLFALFAMLQLFSGFAMYWEKTLRRADGAHLNEVGSYYRGDEPRMMYEKEFPRMLEVTHQHLFSMPLTFLICAHLFLLTGFSRPVKLSVIAVAAFGVGGHLVAPWLVRYGGTGWAWFFPTTALPMFGAMTAMFSISIWEMWHARRRQQPQ